MYKALGIWRWESLFQCIAIGFCFAVTTPADAQTSPPAKVETFGVCPFECCTYRDWTADAVIPVHKNRNEKSAIVFRLRRGQVVQGVTGVVVAEPPAAVTIDRTVRDGYVGDSQEPQLTLNEGDVVYMLSPLGEGFYRFWYQGKVYDSGTDLRAMPGVDGSSGKFVWWKQVRDSSGKTGWTTSNKFKNVDACG